MFQLEVVQGLNRLNDYLFSSYHEKHPGKLYSGFVSIRLLWLDRRLGNGMHLLSNAVLLSNHLNADVTMFDLHPQLFYF